MSEPAKPLHVVRGPEWDGERGGRWYVCVEDCPACAAEAAAVERSQPVSETVPEPELPTLKLWAELDALRLERDAAVQDATLARDQLKVMTATVTAWVAVEDGCGGPACNIGGGLCGECSIKCLEAKDAVKVLIGGIDKAADLEGGAPKPSDGNASDC